MVEASRTASGGEREEWRRPSVLIVDDEVESHETMGRRLEAYRVLHAYNAAQARRAVARHHVDVVLLDLSLAECSGLDLLAEWHPERDGFEVVVVTAHTTIESAVRAVHAGAFDFVAKTYETYQRLGDHVERALEHRRRRRRLAMALDAAHAAADAELFVHSKHPGVREALAQIDALAMERDIAFIEGEPGAGREVLARLLHARSPRSTGAFVVAGVGGVPREEAEGYLFGVERGAHGPGTPDERRFGRLELADGGTLLIEEIEQVDPLVQEKLAVALAERAVVRVGGGEPIPADVRAVITCSRDPEREVTAGRISRRLWQQLAAPIVKVPPLRDRRADLPVLLEALTARHAARLGRPAPRYSPDALEALCAYRWPGNVRELDRAVAGLLARAGGLRVELDDVPGELCIDLFMQRAARDAIGGELGVTSPYDLGTDHFQRYLVRHVLSMASGSKVEAARLLGVSLATLRAKLRDET